VRVTQALLIVHVLGAIVWTGGHVVLTLVVLPRARRAGDARAVQEFEAGYEPLAIPSLLAQIVSGVLLALRAKPVGLAWTDITVFPVTYIALKLLLLFAILGLAVHAKFRVLPGLMAGELDVYARHARAVTLLSVGLVVLGVGLSTGGFR